VIVVPLPEVADIDLFLQNLTVIEPVKPVPVIVNVPPPLRDRVSVDSPVMDGGAVLSKVTEVAPLKAISLDVEGVATGWLIV
jgi:hypothetical protein